MVYAVYGRMRYTLYTVVAGVHTPVIVINRSGEPWIVKRESLAFTVCQRLGERSVRLGAAANVRGGGVDETISATMGARRREWCSSGGPGPAAAAAR